MDHKKEGWAEEARSVLKATIVRSGITYEQLVRRLQAIGVEETVPGVKGKIHRGTFSFIFVIQVLKALDRTKLSID